MSQRSTDCSNNNKITMPQLRGQRIYNKVERFNVRPMRAANENNYGTSAELLFQVCIVKEWGLLFRLGAIFYCYNLGSLGGEFCKKGMVLIGCAYNKPTSRTNHSLYSFNLPKIFMVTGV